jgi:FkbM family methyltransferase
VCKPFSSNAQNLEDVTLWKCLKTIDKGFYIDVGANNPNFDSVTKTFYEKGWRGVNIEPTNQWYQELLLHRPNDINLLVAAGDENGKQIIYEIPDSGLSTSSDVIAERHKKQNFFQITEQTVEVQTIERICSDHDISTIHFLKIDVEGAEKSVIQGINLKINRPWVILVEALQPLTHEECFNQWEHILINGDYIFARFDGLNRYYVAKERKELLDGFKTPPNIFDGFIFTGNGSSPFQQHVAHLKENYVHLEENYHQSKNRIAELENSMSWRLTKPLRLVSRPVISAIKGISLFFQSLAKATILWVLNREYIAARINFVILKLPWLHKQVKKFHTGTKGLANDQVHSANMNQSQRPLTQRAIRIRANLDELFNKKLK